MTGWPWRGAIRTFVVTALALWIPGLLGWLNDLTEWARAEGATPFPDARGLAYLGVSAIVAGVVALVQLAWNSVEDATGYGFLRTPAPKAGRANPDRGAVDTRTLAVIAFVGVAVIVLFLVF